MKMNLKSKLLLTYIKMNKNAIEEQLGTLRKNPQVVKIEEVGNRLIKLIYAPTVGLL